MKTDIARLREIAQVASGRRVRHIPLLETEDTEFLNHYMVTWHINETRILVKEEGNK